MYLDGQKIANKLSKSVNKEIKIIKKLLEDYNTTLFELCDEPLALSEVLCLGFDFWKENPLTNENSDSTIPWHVKQNISHAFLLMERCDEEVAMLRADMERTVKYFANRVTIISRRVELLSDEDGYSRGSKCLLERLKLESELLLQKANAALTRVIDTSCPDIGDEDSDTSEDDYSDTETRVM